MKKLILTALIFLSCNCRNETTTATVVSHSTASSKYGGIYYYTILATNDGSLINKEGMYYYVLSIGSQISITVTKCN
jgi:hypothetical protein